VYYEKMKYYWLTLSIIRIYSRNTVIKTVVYDTNRVSAAR